MQIVKLCNVVAAGKLLSWGDNLPSSEGEKNRKRREEEIERAKLGADKTAMPRSSGSKSPMRALWNMGDRRFCCTLL
jgi:hypothetical protein